MEGASPFMASRLPRASMGQLVFLTPPKSSHPTQLPSRQQDAPITPLAATLMNLPASVENKRLTVELSPLAATLTKTRGCGPLPCDDSTFNPSSSFSSPHLSFHALTNCPFRKPFVLTFMHRMGGVGGRTTAFLKYYFNCASISIGMDHLANKRGKSGSEWLGPVQPSTNLSCRRKAPERLANAELQFL